VVDDDENALEEILARVDEAASLSELRLRRVRIEESIGDIRKLSHQEAPAIQYALGYAHYFHPDRLSDPAIAAEVTAFMGRVLRDRPIDYFAWLYLGHNQYDLGKYSSAASAFFEARRVAPSTYVGLKAHEMLVCSLLRSGREAEALDALVRFAEACEGACPEDVWPDVLAATLVSPCAQSLGNSERFREQLERIDRAGRLHEWLTQTLQRG
jgi:tetratricopeptide (TPR) repeat protein